MATTFAQAGQNAANIANIICMTTIVSGLASSANAEELSAQARQGLEISRTHCARCHVVEPDRPFTGISSTPSFFLMVTALDDWETRFQSFHTRLPHPSIVRFEDDQKDPDREDPNVPVELEYTDIDAILAYARSLTNLD